MELVFFGIFSGGWEHLNETEFNYTYTILVVSHFLDVTLLCL